MLNLTKLWIHVMHSLHEGKESGDPDQCLISQYNMIHNLLYYLYIYWGE